MRSACFELFGDGKYDLFFSQKFDGKMIYTWPFWVFYYIPGPGEYGFSCSVFSIVQGDQGIFFTKALLMQGLRYVTKILSTVWVDIPVNCWFQSNQNLVNIGSWHSYWLQHIYKNLVNWPIVELTILVFTAT